MSVSPVRLRIMFFSVLREKVGRDVLALSLEGPVRGRDLLDVLQERYPPLCDFRPVVRLAVNQTYSPEDIMLADGDEVALITPVSGG
jgi:molybdopterin converting factor subunit 1